MIDANQEWEARKIIGKEDISEADLCRLAGRGDVLLSMPLSPYSGLSAEGLKGVDRSSKFKAP
jgi:hypothetical protein